MENKTVYSEKNPKTKECPAISKNVSCDVLIVGGGLAGLSLAYQLAQQGQNFILIEANRVGEGASGLNGGFCSPGWSVGTNNLIDQYGYETAKFFYDLSIEGLKWVRAFKDTTSFKLMDYKPGTVGLSLLKSEAEARHLFLKSDSSFRKDAQFISKEELKNYVISPEYRSGVFFKSGFSFNPLNFLLALKNQIHLLRPGAIFERSKMVSFSENSESCQVNLANGFSIVAKKLVIATGGYGGGECGFLRTRWLPITTSIVVTSPLSTEVRKLIHPSFAFSDDRRAGNYFRLISKNRLLWGRGINALRCPNKDRLRKMAEGDIRRFFPGLNEFSRRSSLSFDFVWSGKMAYSKSMMPYVGKLTPRIYALTGFGGHGMNTAPAAAKVLCEHLLDLSDRICVFNKIPKHWNGSLFGPIAVETVYGLMAVKDVINQALLGFGRR